MEERKINQIKYYQKHLKHPEDASEKEKRYLTRNSSRYIFENENLYYFNIEQQTKRKVLSRSEAQDALLMHHAHPMGGHMGFKNTLYKISQSYYWDTMAKDVQDYLKRCPRCQSSGPKKTKELLHPVPVGSRPFEKWALDVKHVPISKTGARYIVAGIEYLTKWIEARPLRYQTSAEIASFIYEEIITRHGCPHTIITDNGTPFITNLINRVCFHYNIHHITISVGNSQANGLIERLNGTIGAIIKKSATEDKTSWDQYLPAALFAYRTIKQNTTQYSPFYLTYGYHPKTPYDQTHVAMETKTPRYQYELNRRSQHEIVTLNQIRKDAHEFIQRSQITQKRAIDKKIDNEQRQWKPPFKLGDVVTLYVGIKSNSWTGKISDNWEGIYVIHQTLGKGTYLIKAYDNDATRLKRIHGNRLKLYSLPDVFWIKNDQRLAAELY